MDERGPRDHIVVRLADEGEPIKAIARATRRRFEEVLVILHEAVERGQLLALPPSEWPPGSRREERSPAKEPLRLVEIANFVEGLMMAFRLTHQEARMLAAMVRRREATKTFLHLSVAPPHSDGGSDPKIVDVLVCRLRKKLAPFGVEIETLWGRGYSLGAGTVAVLNDHVRQAIGEIAAPEAPQQDFAA